MVFDQSDALLAELRRVLGPMRSSASRTIALARSAELSHGGTVVGGTPSHHR
jgi:hypothetical protein